MGKLNFMDSLVGCFKRGRNDETSKTGSRDAKQYTVSEANQSIDEVNAIIVIYNEGFKQIPVQKLEVQDQVQIEPLDYAIPAPVGEGLNEIPVQKTDVQDQVLTEPLDNAIPATVGEEYNENLAEDNDCHDQQEQVILEQMDHAITNSMEEENDEVKRYIPPISVDDPILSMPGNSEGFIVTMGEAENKTGERPENSTMKIAELPQASDSWLGIEASGQDDKVAHKSEVLPECYVIKKAKSPEIEPDQTEKKSKDKKKSKKKGFFKKNIDCGYMEKNHMDDEPILQEETEENLMGDKEIDSTVDAPPKKKKSLKKRVVKIITLSKVRKAIRGKTSNK